MSFVSFLYKLARTANTVSTIASGNPKRINRRAGNLLKGRLLARTGFWKKLWK